MGLHFILVPVMAMAPDEVINGDILVLGNCPGGLQGFGTGTAFSALYLP